VSVLFKRARGELSAAKPEVALRPATRIKAVVAIAFFMMNFFQKWLDISGQVVGR